jgi:hypothetical protein
VVQQAASLLLGKAVSHFGKLTEPELLIISWFGLQQAGRLLYSNRQTKVCRTLNR